TGTPSSETRSRRVPRWCPIWRSVAPAATTKGHRIGPTSRLGRPYPIPCRSRSAEQSRARRATSSTVSRTRSEISCGWTTPAARCASPATSCPSSNENFEECWMKLLHHHVEHRSRQLRWVVPLLAFVLAAVVTTLAVQYRVSDQAVGAEFFRAHKT